MRLTSLSLLVVATLLDARGANAQTRVTLVPSVSIGAVYDDNVYARGQGSHGQMVQARPNFEAGIETPRLTFLSLYSFDMMQSDHADLTSLDARRHALVDTQLRMTPETTIAIATHYDRTATPGDINVESGVLSDRTQAQRWEMTPSFIHRIGTRTTMNGGYDWTSENLVDTERGTQHSVRTGLSREVSTRTSLTAGYVGRYFVEGTDAEMSHALLAGWAHAVSSATRVELQAGPRVSSYRGLAAEVLATFARTTNRFGAALDYWRGETIVLGVHGPVAVNSATARVTWPVTRTVELGALTGVSDTSTLERQDATVYRGTVIASWTRRGMLTLAGAYGVDYQLGDIRSTLFADQRVLRHVVKVTMTIAPRLTRSTLPPDEAARAKGVLR